MDVPDPGESHTHEVDGVEVSKWFEDSLFSFPAVAYQLASSREEPVTVRLVESVPADIEPDELGFHPSYGSKYWQADDSAITFEYTLGPTGGFITVCGIRTDDERVEEMLDEPMDVSVIPPDEGDETTDETATDRSQVATTDGSLELEEEPEPGDDAFGTEEAETGSVSGEDDPRSGADGDDESAVFYRSAAESPSSAGPETAPVDEAEAADGEPDDAEGNLHDFVRAVQEGTVAEEDVRVLREIFVSEMLGSESVQTRLRHLQGQVADLQAYTAALEEFIDEHGEGEDIIERHQQQVEAVQDELAALRETVEGNDQRVDSLSNDVADLDADYEQLDDDLESLETTVSDIDERLPEEDVADRFEELEREVVELRNWKENMRQIFS